MTTVELLTGGIERDLTLEQACERHSAIKKIVEAMLGTGEDDAAVSEQQSREIERSSAELEETWQALVGVLPEEHDFPGVISEAIEWTVPREHLVLLRRSDSIAAAYAYVAIVEALWSEERRVDRTNDLEVRDALRRVWQEFDQRRLQANNIEEGFGCDDSASWHTLRDIIEIEDEDLTRKMMTIAKLAGRMFDAMHYTKRKVESDDPQEVRSATIGGDVARLLPAELAKLGNGRTKDVTAMKVLQKQAQVFKMKGERIKSRGPLVLAQDESSSMHDESGPGRNTWAKAAAVALTRIAWSENRRVRCVHFGTSTVVQDVPKDDLDAMFEMSRSFLNSGTNIANALHVALGEVGDLEKQGYTGADVVLVTDGEDRDHDAIDAQNQIIDKMDKRGVRLWTVTVGNETKEDAPTRKRAERYVHARDVDVQDPMAAAEMAADLKGAALSKPEPGTYLN